MTVKFKLSKRDAALLSKCVDRALKIYPGQLRRLDLTMDLEAVHANGCRLDFKRLLAFPDFDFSHDIAGIVNNLDRSTGQLQNCFLPRCAD